MSRPLDTNGNRDHDLTRRDVLHTGLALGTAAVTAAVTPPSAVAVEGKYGGHGVVLNYAYPEVWDPHIAGTLGALGSISPLYNQVVEFNPLKPDEVIGDLAKSWEVTDDGLTYTFQLHEQVKWWDGHDLTAEDVAFSIKRMIAPGEPRPRVGLLRPFIESVEVLDRHRVQIRLKYPSPSFLQFLAVDYMKVVPKHVVEAGVDINRWDNIVGSGPFKTKTARRGDSVTHQKNPTYFKPGRPYLDTLTVRPINDQGTIAAALRTEKVHMTSASFNLSVEDVLKLEPDLKGKYTVHW